MRMEERYYVGEWASILKESGALVGFYIDSRVFL